MPFTSNYANLILNWAIGLGSASLSRPSEVYIGLTSNNPEEASGEIVELSGGGYSRVLCTKTVTLKSGETLINPNKFRSASSASDDTNRNVENEEQINWTKATENWERVNGFFLSTSGTVGETSGIFFYGALTLDEETKAAGGLLVEAGAVALFDPQTFKIEFPAKDVTDEAVTSE